MKPALYLTGVNSFISAIESLKTQPQQIIGAKVRTLLPLIHHGVTSRTPVHTGKTLRNWVWSMDRPASSADLPALGSGDPGQTSKMALGTEPRRADNQSAVDATYDALDLSQPLRAYYLTNTSDTVLGLEYGQLPTPEGSRSPGGMARVTLQEVLAALR